MTATLGIDLSSQPKNTAVCLVEWSTETAEVVALWRGRRPDGSPLTDGILIAAMRGAYGDASPSKVAIDAPLGWPVDFVRGISDLDRWPVKIDASRARLERRATDHWVHKTTGKLPLSVTTDRIAYGAMRAAGLLAHYTACSWARVDRSGVNGLVCEAYPDPTIRRFGIWPRAAGARDSYKGDAQDIREGIIDELRARAPWLALGTSDRSRCIESDDCLDALICALAARAAEQGKTIAPPADLADEAAAEGWIHLPDSDSLSALL